MKIVSCFFWQFILSDGNVNLFSVFFIDFNRIMEVYKSWGLCFYMDQMNNGNIVDFVELMVLKNYLQEMQNKWLIMVRRKKKMYLLSFLVYNMDRVVDREFLMDDNGFCKEFLYFC